MDQVLENLKQINSRLDTIEKHLKIIHEHVIFVEDTYSSVRSPLSFMKTKIEQMMGMDPTPTLPMIKPN